jgi:predicted metal-dependent enzyme (double-stranded beta helix superfamily)
MIDAPRFQRFVAEMTALVACREDEADILEDGAALLAGLVAHDDWLPDHCASPDPTRYQQYLLHRDPAGRFSVVSFVWAPGQATPVHDHTVWGLVGVLRGAEVSQGYRRTKAGLVGGEEHRLEPGAVEAVSPRIGDIHKVANAYDDRVSISIHVYGADIGAVKRSTYNAAGEAKAFVSGYANA